MRRLFEVGSSQKLISRVGLIRCIFLPISEFPGRVHCLLEICDDASNSEIMLSVGIMRRLFQVGKYTVCWNYATTLLKLGSVLSTGTMLKLFQLGKYVVFLNWLKLFQLGNKITRWLTQCIFLSVSVLPGRVHCLLELCEDSLKLAAVKN